MPSSFTQSEPDIEYLSCIAREEELGRLRGQAKIRKSLLVFGPEAASLGVVLEIPFHRELQHSRAIQRIDNERRSESLLRDKIALLVLALAVPAG